MILQIEKDRVAAGLAAAELVARRINLSIAQRGEARILLSTGASQFEMFENLHNEPIDWTRVTMFHLDEYVGLSSEHIASFRKYLKERFVDTLPLPLKNVHYVNGEGTPEEVAERIEALTELFKAAPIDVGVVGIGENGHIAFNDPPADFDTDETYITVNLDDRCKAQQVREKWFASPEEVPDQAISMAPKAILSCRAIISLVPGIVKADAIKKTFSNTVTPSVPATLLKTHPDWTLILDSDSASQIYAQ